MDEFAIAPRRGGVYTGRMSILADSPVLAVGAVATAFGLLAAIAFPRAEALFVDRARGEAAGVLRLVVDAVDRSIERYAALPPLVADDPLLGDVLREAGNAGLVPFANEKLRIMGLSLGVSDVYLMDRRGMTVAASNYRRDASFLGRSFSYRPYFVDALAGGSAFFHAMGTTSGERGFYFAAPVLDGIEVIGVLAIKVSVAGIETAWPGTGREILVVNPDGIVFLASRPAFRLRPLAPLGEGQRARIAETRQFPLDRLEPLPLSPRVLAARAVAVTPEGARDRDAYLAVSAPMALAGWHGVVLEPMGPVRGRAAGAVGFGALVLAALLLTALLVQQRRQRLRLLESQVRARTTDLDAANASLRREVRERKATEDRLRRSQKELVQAGKLAALGKMSAALSHEINQPLAAVKSYADNAARFLERGRVPEAGGNIARISEMADRMAGISRHLREFARQPGERLRATPVRETVVKAVEIVAPQMRERGVRVILPPPGDEAEALGGALRLQQVFVNLLTNAADAMAQGDRREIEIGILAGAAEVAVAVRDHGPGIPADVPEQMFEAFFTTKEAGVGMGLGLSISYNIVEDFGGRLTAANHPEGGAVFTVVLRRYGAEGAA